MCPGPCLFNVLREISLNFWNHANFLVWFSSLISPIFDYLQLDYYLCIPGTSTMAIVEILYLANDLSIPLSYSIL